jgi:hypothetical protein
MVLKVVFGLPMFSMSTEVAALLREKSIPVVILQLYVGNFPNFTVTVKLRKIRISRIFLHTEEKYSSRRRKA